MHPHAIWPNDPIFIELDVQDAQLAAGLQLQGYSKYLGISKDSENIKQLQAENPELAGKLVCAKPKRAVLHNNANVLVLSGLKTQYLWRFRYTRHAQSVAWRIGFNPLCWLALIGCLFHMTRRRYARPRIVSFSAPHGKTTRFFVCRVLRHKYCHRNSLHFVPHAPGLTGMFRAFDENKVRYVVLRWFESLPEIEPSEDVDVLIADDSLKTALEILHSQPGFQLTDVYSETGLPRSEYCGVAYYPPQVARRILDGAVRHNNLCYVPSKHDYFHSLAYHAVYHKGLGAGLPTGGASGLQPRRDPGHNYTSILRGLAEELGIDVEISLEGLHAYLGRVDWSPTADGLARLAGACPRNAWLQHLAKQLTPEMHDQGVTVFVLRREAIRRGFKDKMLRMIEESGFEILAVKMLSPEEVEYSASRTRGGNWSNGPYVLHGGPPAACVVVYDRKPIALNRKQRRRFPQRTNARIFVKETIRDAVLAYLPPNEQFNALHSSDHAAEAWHLIDVLAPEMKHELQARIAALHEPAKNLSISEYAAESAATRKPDCQDAARRAA